MYAGATAQSLPIVTAAIRRRPLAPAHKWVIGWCGLLVLGELVALTLALQNRNNHWLDYLITPIAAALVLWAFSFWQTTPVATLSFRILVPLLGITWVGMVLLVEDTTTFSLLAEPFAGLLVTGGAVYTLISGAFRETGNLLKQDWLWIGLGVVLVWGSAVALPPTAHWLLSRHPELVVRVYQVRALIQIVAFLAIARGILCPIAALRSGGSSSRASSRSPSSLPASSPPS